MMYAVCFALSNFLAQELAELARGSVETQNVPCEAMEVLGCPRAKSFKKPIPGELRFVF